jgi:hypothetical protein
MEMDKRIEEVEASNLERVLHSVAGAKAKKIVGKSQEAGPGSDAKPEKEAK